MAIIKMSKKITKPHQTLKKESFTLPGFGAGLELWLKSENIETKNQNEKRTFELKWSSLNETQKNRIVKCTLDKSLSFQQSKRSKMELLPVSFKVSLESNEFDICYKIIKHNPKQ